LFLFGCLFLLLKGRRKEWWWGCVGGWGGGGGGGGGGVGTKGKDNFLNIKDKGNVIPLQARCGPEGE